MPFKLRLLAYLAEIEQIRAISGSVTHLEEVLRLVGDQAVDSVRVVFDIDLWDCLLLKGDLFKHASVLTELRRFCPVFVSLKEELLEFYQSSLPVSKGIRRRLRIIWLEKKGR